MRRALGAAFAGALAAACASPIPVTELMIVVDSDLRVPGELERVRIEVRDDQGAMQDVTADLAGGAPRPVVLGVVSRTSLGPIEVRAIGERGGVEVLRRTARVSFIPERTLVLRLDLLASCVATSCGEAQTCGETGCGPIEIASESLPEWSGTPPALDGGTRAEVDSAMPDAAMPDAAMPDSAMPPVDAGIDAPVDAMEPECRGASDCDDGVACTDDACRSGSCVHTPRAGACDDSVPCTIDECDALAGCTHTPDASACDDGVSCTAESCDAIAGCRSTPIQTGCAPGSYCDPVTDCTTAPTFTQIYTDILGARCGPCHTTAGSRGGGLDFATQSVAYSELVGMPAQCGGGTNVLVIPRDATRSLLWRKLSGVNLCGDMMPRASLSLEPALIAQVAQWINAGALE